VSPNTSATHVPVRDPCPTNRVSRSAGPVPSEGGRSHRQAESPGSRAAPGSDREDDTGRSRRTEGCTDYTVPVLRRSSGPSLPDRFHQILALTSPPFCHYLPNTLLSTDQTVDLVLCLRHGRARVRRHALAALPDAASGRSGLQARVERPAAPGTRAYPAALRNRRAYPQTRGSLLHSTLRRGRSSDPGLVALFHQILARHSPPFCSYIHLSLTLYRQSYAR
jgi:hypothetical protein